jgi:putative membrane protein
MNAARLATRKTQHSAVKEFAQRMADDHSSANARLAAIAKQARVPLPSESDPDHRAMEDRLQQTTGTQFDLDYMREQLVDHQKTAQLLAWEIDSGEDGDLRQFASETLPIIYHHLRMTQDILDQLAGQTPQGTGQRPAASPQ